VSERRPGCGVQQEEQTEDAAPVGWARVEREAGQRPDATDPGGTLTAVPRSSRDTALQRGTVEGFGFTDISLVPLGLHKVIKYRIQPNYYQTNTVVTVHADTWNKLAQDKRDAMTALAKEYETSSVHWIEKLSLIHN